MKCWKRNAGEESEESEDVVDRAKDVVVEVDLSSDVSSEVVVAAPSHFNETVAPITTAVDVVRRRLQALKKPEWLFQNAGLSTSRMNEFMEGMRFDCVMRLEGNELKTLPSRLMNSPDSQHVAQLMLARNALKKVDFAQSELSQLHILSLSENCNCKVLSLPPRLTKLYLQNMNLTHMPDALRELSSLQSLSLANNAIVQLPQWLEQ